MTDVTHPPLQRSSASRSDESGPQVNRQSGFRPDIEGMRGIAVAIVVLFHAEVKWFTGGFVGVDVFFVLSGFLITGLLVDERIHSGRIAFGDFYARRVRRLLPASMLVLVVTITLAVVLVPAVDLVDLRSQAWWVALFGSNIWFARHATDYLRPDVVSPFQQYWSLAVEEQFYLLWPLLLLALGVRARSPGALLRRALTGLGMLVASSFVLSIHLTSVRQPSAFFLLPPRAWELGAGGLLAIGLRLGFVVPQRMRTSVALVGSGLVLVPVMVYGSATAFPGWTAVAPVLGTVAILAAGDGSTARTPIVTRVLSAGPLRLVGRYSYSLYLWHWPLLVLPVLATGRKLELSERLGLVVVAVVVSVASFHLVEDRLRHLPVLIRVRSASYLLGVGLVAVALLSVPMLPTWRGLAEGAGRSVRGPESDLSEELESALVEAPADQADVYHNECHRPLDFVEGTGPIDPSACTSGVVGGVGVPTVMLLGDSHAAHFQPALSVFAGRNGWRLVSMTRSFCPLVKIPVRAGPRGERYAGCDEWRQRVFDLVATTRPSAVILGHRSGYYVGQRGLDDWTEALDATVEQLSTTTRVIVLRDLPRSPSSVPECIVSNGGDLDDCNFGSTAADLARAGVERRVVETAGGAYLDPVPIVCPAERCPVVANDEIVFSDSNHLTASFSRTIAERLGRLVESALGV